ncbi:MAG: hypothetical protein KF878_12920 [Planctomycetes bacterium]|nr:hypothetical protein [Planctomycetota bacterium]
MTRLTAGRLARLVLVLALPATTGCGFAQLASDEPERADWPLLALPPDVEMVPPRPTAAVRMRHALADAGTQDRFHPAFRAPFSSGLFSSVTYDVGGCAETTVDYFLDISLEVTNPPLGLSAIPGALTLGCLPFPWSRVHTATLHVRDGLGRDLGRTEVSGELTTVVWTPLLPLNLAVALLDSVLGVGPGSGLSPTRWESERIAFQEELVRVALARAHARFGFLSPERAARD